MSEQDKYKVRLVNEVRSKELLDLYELISRCPGCGGMPVIIMSLFDCYVICLKCRKVWCVEEVAKKVRESVTV